MARRRSRVNGDWETPEKDFKWEHVSIEVLMDIRDEMQKLNRLLHCNNVVGGFRALTRIDKRLREIAPLKKVRKPR